MSLRCDENEEVRRINELYCEGFCEKTDVVTAVIGHFYGILEDGNPLEKRGDVTYVLGLMSSLMKDADTKQTTGYLCSLYQSCKPFESDQYFLAWDANTQCVSMEYRPDYSDSITYDDDFVAHGLWRMFD